MKKLSILLAIAAMIACFAAISVSAAGNSFETAQTIYVNTNVSGNFADATHDYYKFTINYAAVISLPAQWSDGSWNLFFWIYDINKKTMGSWSYKGTSATAGTIYLEPGTYYLEVINYANCTYNFSVKYQALTETVPEAINDKNDNVKDADIIHMNKTYYGVMSKYDTGDWYKFYVDEPKRIAIRYTNTLSTVVEATSNNANISLSNIDGGYIGYNIVDKTTEGSITTAVYDIKKAGTYCVRISGYCQGTYALAVLDGTVNTLKDAPIRPLSSNVTVTIPTFPVTINGIKKDNTYAQYPYIVYNNITYCPMTYHGARFLGLSTSWSADAGIGISKLAGGGIGYGDTAAAATPNKGSYTATKTNDFVTVNGTLIDNYAEEYPVLKFRDVTYFPLTWRFAVTEFGWNYNFTTQGGLVINSK